MSAETRKVTDPDREPSANRDPITGAPGSHPVGTGVGAAGAGAAGAAIGAAGGPVGAVVGAAIGAVAGGLVGKGVAEGVNPTAEDEYWRSNYQSRPYVSPGTRYEDYQPAYRWGWESRSRYAGRRFEDVESNLRTDWESNKSKTKLEWERAKAAMRDAWDRLEHRERSDRVRDSRAEVSSRGMDDDR